MDNLVVGAALAGIGFMILIGILFIIGAILYVIGSYATMVMAQRRGIENAWLAWIPFGNMYILGLIIRDCDIGTFNVNKLEMVLPIAMAASMVLSGVPLIGSLISLAVFILYIFVSVKLFKMYAPENVVLYTVLSCIGLLGIMMFIIKDRDPVEVPSAGKPIFS